MSNRINLVRGTSKTFEVDLVDENGNPIDMLRLAGASAEFLLRIAPSDVSNVLRFTTVANPTRLVFRVDSPAIALSFTPLDSSGLAIQIYFYQLEVTLTDGSVLPVIEWSPFDVNLGGSAVPTPPPFPNTVKIDENFRLPNDMTYMTPGGSPIENAQIRVYLKSDYDVGNLGAPIGITTTNAFGGWLNPILVQPGFTYVARFEKPNEWGPNTKEFFA